MLQKTLAALLALFALATAINLARQWDSADATALTRDAVCLVAFVAAALWLAFGASRRPPQD